MTYSETLNFLNALLLAFSAFGTVIGAGSATLAFYEWVTTGLRPTYIGDAVNLGIALSFLPGAAFAAIVFDVAYTGAL